jgi:hypothetical protein
MAASAIAAIALVFVPSAAAVPPVLLTVGSQNLHPSATFSAPRSDQVVIQIATRPDRASSGEFLTENVEVFDVLTDSEIQTGNWLYESQQDPGTYYVLLRASPDFDLCYLIDSGTFDPSCANGYSEMKTLTSKIYAGMSANYWVYVNAGVDTTRGAPLMVWQDGETIVGNQDLLRLRLQIVSDNLVHKKLIPPMVHVLISPGNGGEAQGTRMRSIQYDTVSDRYGKYLMEEVLPEVEKMYKLRQDGYSRAIGGESSGGICAFNAAWLMPEKFARVHSAVGSFTSIQWR